ncbi:hypothetical protein ACHAXT_009012 [Thalassiosira profunda]
MAKPTKLLDLDEEALRGVVRAIVNNCIFNGKTGRDDLQAAVNEHAPKYPGLNIDLVQGALFVAEETSAPLPQSLEALAAKGKQGKANNNSAAAGKETPEKKKRKYERSPLNVNVDDAVLVLPPPANGTQYRKPEVADILAQYPVKSRERGAVVDKMIALDYIPRPRGETKDASLKRTIRRLMEKHAKGLPIGDSEWTMGKPVVLAGQPGESPQSEGDGPGESGGTGESQPV